jgi:sirohydrochlorin cobaltochelatase
VRKEDAVKKLCLIVWAGLLGLVISGTLAHAGRGENRPERRAIVLAAFGTTVPEAQRALSQVEQRVRETFPGVEVRWGYTSRMVRSKLAGDGKLLDSPEMALARLMDEGFTHVAVLSLHTIPGREFHELTQNARLFQQMSGGFEKVVVALPLLSSREDQARVARAILRNVPSTRKPQDGVLLMGHGSGQHPSDAIYAALGQVLSELDPHVHVATVDGYPRLEDVLPRLEAARVRKVILMPLMAVAGDHARNDMAGSEPDSWKSVLQSKGYDCEVVLKGTAEYPEIVDVWLDHLRDAMEQFQYSPR